MQLVLFAQDALLAGTSGWIGTGLLGTVLAWLMLKHLPDKDKQLKEIMDSKDRLLMEQHKLLNDEHAKQVNLVVQHCKTEMEGVHSLFKTEMADLGEKISAALKRGE